MREREREKRERGKPDECISRLVLLCLVTAHRLKLLSSNKAAKTKQVIGS